MFVVYMKISGSWMDSRYKHSSNVAFESKYPSEKISPSLCRVYVLRIPIKHNSNIKFKFVRPSFASTDTDDWQLGKFIDLLKINVLSALTMSLKFVFPMLVRPPMCCQSRIRLLFEVVWCIILIYSKFVSNAGDSRKRRRRSQHFIKKKADFFH